MSMHRATERTGLVYITLHTILWGLFPVFAKSTFADISPFWSLGIGTFSAAILFGLIVSIKKEWKILPGAVQSKGVWVNTIFNGTLYYICFYIGLRTTAAGNASIVGLFEVLTTIVILGLVRKSERMTALRIVGSLLLLLGVLIILLRNVAMPQGGELLILFATFLVPLGNLAGKDALSVYGTTMVLFVRSMISGIILCLLAWVIDGLPSMESLMAALPVVLLTGVILLGLAKVFWMESMVRVQIAMGVSMGSLSPIITLLAGVFLLGESIHVYYILALIPILIGIRLLLRQPRAMVPVSLEI